MMRLGGYRAKVEDLDKVIERLLEVDKKGDVLYCDIDGYRLHSDNVTVDNVYMAVMGRTKEEIENGAKRVERSFDEQELVLKDLAKRHIPYWIEEGKKYIYEERYEEWEKCVNIRANDLYCGTELDLALDVMDELERTSHLAKYGVARYKSIAGNMLGRTGKPYLILSILLSFAKEGPELYEAFVRFFDYRLLSPEEKRNIEEKKGENYMYRLNEEFLKSRKWF